MASELPTPEIKRSRLSISATAEKIFWILLWIVLSTVIILLNKWILTRFPYSITLTTWHMLFATISTQTLALTTDLIDQNVKMTTSLYFKAIVPIAMCLGGSLILSNMAYLYLSMAFIQMLKAIGPVATLLACWSIGLRNPAPSVKILCIVCIIVAGVMIASAGEVHFVIMGVIISGLAVIFESYKNALQQRLLGGKMKMGSLTLLYYFAPACTVLNLGFIFAFELPNLSMEAFNRVGVLVFLLNGLLTLGLNLASTSVIKKTSSLVLTLCGIPKSIMLVGLDMALYQTPMSMTQAVGFSIAGAGTYFYSRLSKSPTANGSGDNPDEKDDDERLELLYEKLSQTEEV